MFNDLLVAELEQERQRQIDKGFGPEWDDDSKTLEDWCNDIEAYVVWARQMYRMRSPEKYRRRMKQIAVLAIAACESFDRLYDEDTKDMIGAFKAMEHECN